MTGASGYVGGRLLHTLVARGTAVRCLTRRPAALAADLGPGCEVVRGDCLDAPTLAPAHARIRVAFYAAAVLRSFVRPMPC